MSTASEFATSTAQQAQAGTAGGQSATNNAQGTTRLSVNINAETARALQELAKRHSTTVTEIVRRAVGVYKFVDDETQKPNTTLQIVHDDARERAIIHLV